MVELVHCSSQNMQDVLALTSQRERVSAINAHVDRKSLFCVAAYRDTKKRLSLFAPQLRSPKANNKDTMGAFD